MNVSARLLVGGEFDFHNGHMPDVSELRTRREPSADLFVEPLSLLVAELAGITSRIQEIEHSHLERMESAAAQLRDRLRDQIATEVRNQLQAEFQTGIEIIREEFKERMSAATTQWEAERQSLLNEVEDLRQRNNCRDTSAEVAQTEAELEAVQKKIQAMLDDSTVELSRVMKENSRQVELQAYLKGLRFKAVPSSASEMQSKA